MIVLGVDEGDVEAIGVDELGEVEHGGYVSLCWGMGCTLHGVSLLVVGSGYPLFFVVKVDGASNSYGMVLFMQQFNIQTCSYDFFLIQRECRTCMKITNHNNILNWTCEFILFS